jgi:hypothetical protein
MKILLYFKQAFCLIVAIILMFGINIANASPISINNPSFEEPTHTDGGFTAVATGWVVTGDSGTWNPTTAQISQGPTDGLQVGFSNNGGLSQTLSAVLTANMRYTLMVDVLSRTDGFFHRESGLELLTAEGTQLAATILGPITAGNNGLLSLTFVASANDPNLGKNLKITLLGIGGPQSDWDNVRLDATPTITPNPVPLPGAIWLLGSGLVGILGMRKRLNSKAR